jgi:four helix bundle protein
MQDFKKLLVWQRAHLFTLAVHRGARHFPRRGFSALKSQLTRAAESVAANIVEGCGAATQPELARYLDIAIKSANETEHHLLIARDLGALPHAHWQPLNSELIESRRMTYGLRRRVLNLPHSKP